MIEPNANTDLPLNEFCSQISSIAGQAIDPNDPRTLVGVIQRFRPDPEPLRPAFANVPAGGSIFERLQKVFETAENPRRSDGMKDAFFIVRRPRVSDAEILQQHGETFLESLLQLAKEQNKSELCEQFATFPRIRLLEGAAPKHPKLDHEKSQLLKVFSEFAPRVTEDLIAQHGMASYVQRAFYFLACDAFLRDYLLWPWINNRSALVEPFESYFQLWQHGVKYRIFGNQQVDLYVPRDV